MTGSPRESASTKAGEQESSLLAPLSLEGLTPLGSVTPLEGDVTGLCSGGVCRLPAPVDRAQ